MSFISESDRSQGQLRSIAALFERFNARFSNNDRGGNNSIRGGAQGQSNPSGNASSSEKLRPTTPTIVSRSETLDSGPATSAPGVAVSLSGGGTNAGASLLNQGAIVGRGQAPASDVTAGDGVRFEGPRAAEGGFEAASFGGIVANQGSITSESEVGSTAGLRFVDGVGVQGPVINAPGGEISGTNNGVYFGEADHSGGRFVNAGTVSSDSRAVNIDGDGLQVVNAGAIVGTGDQRNGTVYSDNTASNFDIVNTGSGVIDAGEGNDGAGISLSLEADGSNGEINVINQGTVAGRGQADASAATAGDGIRLEGNRSADGVPPGIFEGNVVNRGSVTSESGVGATSGFRAVDGLGVQGNIINGRGGEISGTNNGVYFGDGDHSGGRFVNAGTVSSDSRAVNIDGDGLQVVNAGAIVGTGDQRNGTVYSDNTASNFDIVNTGSGVIDAGEGNDGAGISLSLEADGSNGEINVVNRGSISGRGQGDASAATAGDGIRLEGNRSADGVPPGIFEGNVVNRGSVTSESGVGATSGFRAVDGLGVQGNIINGRGGEISGTNNGVYFGDGDHSGGRFVNAGTVSSDSRAVNIDGDGLQVVNTGAIVGTGDQRNGTVYSDNTASNFDIVNTGSGVIDAGEGNEGAGISLSLEADGSNGEINVVNRGSISGRGQGDASAATAGDGIRLEGNRSADGVPPGIFEGNVVNRGSIASESGVGPTAGFRTVDGLGVQGNVVNRAGGEISGTNNGVYFGDGDHSGGRFVNRGTVSSDSRAVNIDGDGLQTVNSGTIIGTGDQRNGTVYGDGSAENFSVTNTASGVIDAGEGNNGSALAHEIGDETGDLVDGSINNAGTLQGRGTGDTAATIGHGLRLNGGAGTEGTAAFTGDIVNSGNIAGSADSAAAAGISIEEVGVSGPIVNTGSVSGSVNAIDASTATSGITVVNAGEIDGNVILSENDDVFTLREGGSIDGLVDGGEGFDTLNLDFDDEAAAVQFANSEDISGFERINISGVQYNPTA